MPVLFAGEDGVESPLGTLAIDTELREPLRAETGGSWDTYSDNTVEVLIPMVRYFHPDSRILWMRLPAETGSFETGKLIARAAKKSGRSAAVLGSTDLTHYGSNYGFSPKGRGEAALRWVREVNDRAFIDAVEEGDPEKILRVSEDNRSACSAGAVLGALGFAREVGALPARLLAYGTSADVSPGVPDSFVGYGAFGFFS
jgi:AmmeMemoRadiSam system protein B